jgi:hypothetical protein
VAVQHQDSDDPTGVRGKTSGGTGATGNQVSRARSRKANAAIQLRLAGATWEEIALSLGYPTPRQALIATERALEKQLATDADRDKMRKLANARLERLLRSVWPKAIDPEHPDHLIALTKARELIGQHSKLFGLDAPTEVVVHNPTATELESWAARVIEVLNPVVAEYDILDGEVVDPPAIEAS